MIMCAATPPHNHLPRCRESVPGTAPLRYRIVANPVSGTLSPRHRHVLLKKVASVLAAQLHGLDTRNAREMACCLRQQAARCDVLVVAGGDGMFSLAANTVDLSQTALAFLPLGTGNALTHALGYRGELPDIARRIRAGAMHRYDLIDCDGRKKAFMASLGIDATVLRLFERHRSEGGGGIKAHIRAVARSLLKEYRPAGCHADIDGRAWQTPRLLSLMVVKQPFLGMGLKAVPRARWNDGLLHVQTIASGLPGALAGLVTGFTIGNRIGAYRRGRKLQVVLERALTLQTDGDLAWSGKHFTFRILPGLLTLRH